ncbi:MAG: NAD(P)/FAD-dependent oxidoreductase [Bacteroidia bacterium]|nr:NAD(P)/FAD-dependent oxidoreductase [Bacteroidia bacterium]
MGSGLGGLLCAYILASEGNSVIVLEKNNQLGGNLQVFSRDKCIFDTGVHYIGSLDEGENLKQFFRYFGLLDNIKLKRMDDDGYDVIRFADGKEYKHGQGYERFIGNLVKDFPDEEKAIQTFCDKVREVCKFFPLYNLETEISMDYFLSEEIRELNAYKYIASLTPNVRLQNVLAGSNPLYAGVKDKTPFYVHALILNSYITGSYKLIDGGSQIATYLSKVIRKMGGDVFKRKKVIGANYHEDGKIAEVLIEGGEVVKGEKFISNIHPAVTIDIFGENRFLNAYRKRVKTLENTMSSFTVHLTFKKDTFKYLNHNIYQYNVEDVWAGIDYKEETWPEGYFVCTPATSKSEEYADSMSIMTYMDIRETAEWDKTFNTTASPEERGEGYEKFKKLKEDKVLEKIEMVFPDIRSKIKSVYSSTPLTFRDYIGNYDGSMYGILKDSNNPAKSFINTKTKIPNLFLTGQNLIFHGILGVTIGAFVTCFEFVDRNKLMEKVKKAK